MVSILGSLQIDTSDVTKGSYIACMYDDEVWFGCGGYICEVFMHPSVGVSSYVFPEKDDTCWIYESYILCTHD